MQFSFKLFRRKSCKSMIDFSRLTELFVPHRRAHQPGHVLWAHPPALLARVVRGPGGLPLRPGHWAQRHAIQAPRPGPLLSHRHFPGDDLLAHFSAFPPLPPFAHFHSTGAPIARQRPHGPLSLRLRHGHRVLWNRSAQVLTKHDTHS